MRRSPRSFASVEEDASEAYVASAAEPLTQPWGMKAAPMLLLLSCVLIAAAVLMLWWVRAEEDPSLLVPDEVFDVTPVETTNHE